MNMKFLPPLALCCVVAFNAFAADDRIVAEYDNGKTISKSEVSDRLRVFFDGKLPEGKKDFDDLDPNTKQAVIQDVVQEKVLESDMDHSKLKDSKIFQQKVDLAKKKAALDVYFQSYVKRNLNEGMVKAEYNKTVAMLKSNPELKVSHILVATKEEADKAIADIKSGTSFEDEAKKVSLDKASKDKGGEVGYISRGQVPAIEKVAYSLKVSEISAPVHTDAGWHILKVIEIKAREIPSFDTVKAQIEQQTAYKAVSDYIQKLMSEAKVKIFVNKDEGKEKAK